MIRIVCVLLCLLVASALYAIDRGDYILPTKKPKVILIIDDLGDNYRLGQRILDLPVSLNLAFLPNTPFATRLAQQAHKKGHDIMLHFPMEATTRPDLLGRGALVSVHNEKQAHQIFKENLDQIPHVQGFNNHMGSLITGSAPHMSWVMEFAAQNDLYFVDSRTASNSVAFRFAERAGIPSLDRDVFLDPDKNADTIKAQFAKALAIADKKGQVVLIGHPYKETIHLLEKELPSLAGRYHWITVTDYWSEKLPRELQLPVPAIGDGANLSISGNLPLFERLAL